jgi:hypothetical protein
MAALLPDGDDGGMAGGGQRKGGDYGLDELADE